MNLKTTLALLVLLGAGATAWFGLVAWQQPTPETSPTLTFLHDELKPAALTRIEVMRDTDPRFVLERKPGAPEWSLSGNWQVRTPQVEAWLKQLTSLDSRFVPIPLTSDTDLATFGLTERALVIKLKVNDAEHTLRLSEEPGETNRFTRPTYLRLDDQPEVVRLGPGLVAALDREQAYFQQRRLFPVERVARDEGVKEKVERLAARAVEVKSPQGTFRLVKKGDDWRLSAPVEDRTDPEKLRALLTGFPDLWAEKFVDRKGKKDDAFGLAQPEYTLTVTRPNGEVVKLLVGKVSETRTRVVKTPPPPMPFGQPPRPQLQVIREEYRFAKLANNEQVFEVKAEKLPEIAVALDVLRDPQLARFRTDDVRRLEVRQGSTTLLFIKDGAKWRLEQPVKEDAETRPVDELLDRLSLLRARDKEVHDQADPKAFGLEKPRAVVTLSVEEGKDRAKKITRTVVFRVGGTDKKKDKLYVAVEGRPRVNEIDTSLLKLVERPALAYRSRRVLDVAAADLKRIEVRHAGEVFALVNDGSAWKLAAPVNATADAAKVRQLADELGRLEGVEFVKDRPDPEELKKYGLAEPTIEAKLSYADMKKPVQTLAVGAQRPGKQDYFARLDTGPVFAVKKELRDTLDRSSLTYRPLTLWELSPGDVTEISVQRGGATYRLRRDGKLWTISGPFDAPAVPEAAEILAAGLAQLRAEKIAAHQTKEPARFGLEKPTVQVEFVTKSGAKHAIDIGKPAEGAKGRYARAGGGAIVVLNDKVVSLVDRAALDLLDRDLLTLDAKAITKVQFDGTVPFALVRDKGLWKVIGSPAPPFTAEEDAAQETLAAWARLRAEKFAAYGPKIDWQEYGLAKPTATVTLTLTKDGANKGGSHVVALGKTLTGGGRYARLDQKDAVAVLDARSAEALARSHVDFVDPRVLKYDLDTVTGLRRAMKGADLELSKRDDLWQIVKPASRPADDPTVNDLLEKTFRLRARRVAAYPVKDLKPFGLDVPAAVWTLVLTDASGAPSMHTIKIGKPSADARRKDTDERFAVIDGGQAVVVLPAALSRHLVAPTLHFADRNLASFGGADQATLQRGPRRITFTKEGAAWRVQTPALKSEVESAALDDFVRALQRLRVEEIVAGKGADLKSFGLDRPLLQWQFRLGDKVALHLLLGATTAKGAAPRYYGKLAGRDEVFVLGDKLSAQALAEYRSRKPWTALDAAQVNRLMVKTPDKTFTLVKNEAGWSVMGDPAQHVNPLAVTDTLDALAGLKVQHYVVDAKANLQLYGLKSPAWVIEVQTPAGARTLLLGRTEGESQRFYAALPEGDAVFVLSEADSRRLAKPLSAFVQKGAPAASSR